MNTPFKLQYYFHRFKNLFIQEIAFKHHAILWSIALFSCAALLWASLGTIDLRVQAYGQLVYLQPTQVLQNFEGGVVKSILVKEGDIVKQNDVLMELDDTRFLTQLNEMKINKSSIGLNIGRLKALLEKKKDVDFSLVDDAAGLVVDAVKDTQLLLEQELSAYQLKLNMFEEEHSQLASQLQSSKIQLTLLEKNFALIEDEKSMKLPLLEKGVISKLEMMRLEKAHNDANESVTTAKAQVAKLEQSLKSHLVQKQEYIQNQAATWNKELQSYQVELSAVEEQLLSLSDKVKRTKIVAPINGIINNLKITTLGASISPTQPILELVPLEGDLKVEAYLHPKDVGFVQPGMKVKVQVSAYDASLYGALDGVLERISGDSLSVSREGPKENALYKVVIRIEANQLNDKNPNLKLKPGMQVVVNILNGKQSILMSLLKPITKTIDNALHER